MKDLIIWMEDYIAKNPDPMSGGYYDGMKSAFQSILYKIKKMQVESFSKNELLEMMYLNTAHSLRSIIEQINNHTVSKNETTNLLIEIAENLEAQSIVVKLRDDINKL